MSDGGIVTAEVNGFTVTTNSGVTEAQLRQNLKPKSDEAASQAGKELGKRGGEAAAKAREAKAEEKPDAEEVQEKPEAKPIKPIPPEKVEAKPEEKAEPDEKLEDKAEEKPPEKDHRGDPRHDPRARMLEATRKEAEAKRALAAERETRAALEARLAALERGERPTPPPAERKPWDKDEEPEPEPFVAESDSYEQGMKNWLRARDEWRDKQTEKRAKQEAQRVAFENKRNEFRESVVPHSESISTEILTLQTEWQALEEGKPITGANYLANEFFFNPKSAPSWMLYLTEHPEDFQRISALTNFPAVSRELGRIDARLESATSGDGTKREDVSRAAPPVKPVTGKPYVSESDEYREGMTLDEYAKIWNKQKRLR